MRNTTIYFIRHGEVDNPKSIIYGRTDISLSIEGFQQIENLAKKLKNSGVTLDVIYTSPLRRTIQSAKKIIEFFGGAKMILENSLQDTDARQIEGRSMDWLKSIDGDVYNSKETRNLSIERPEAVAGRMLAIIEDIKEKHVGETIAVISHGDPLAFLIWRLLYPEKESPSIAILAKGDYLKKGEAWKIVFGGEGEILENKLITRNENLVRGEREY